jgi:hypothetical protein
MRSCIYFLISDLPRQSRLAKVPVVMQVLNCDLQAALQAASKWAGQRVATHWKKASEQVLAMVQMPVESCAKASCDKPATRHSDRAQAIDTDLSTGTNPLAFLATMPRDYATMTTPPKGCRCRL